MSSRETRLLLAICLLLQLAPAQATAGFAETSWLFHDGAGTLIRWDHGDVCRSDGPRDPNLVSVPDRIPGKDCFQLMNADASDRYRSRLFVVPMRIGTDAWHLTLDVRADEPQWLYWNTASPLAMLLMTALGGWILWCEIARGQAWRPGRLLPGALLAVLGASQALTALHTLFPVGLARDNPADFVQLLGNLGIVVSPAVLWLTLWPPRSTKPVARATRIGRYGVIVASSACAPFLVFGPPSLLQLLVPLLLIPNIVMSLAVVVPAQKLLQRQRQRP